MNSAIKHLGTFQDKKDGTIKTVFKAKHGVIETAYIKNKQYRNIDVFCIPTHHYCNLGCVFCHLTSTKTKKPMIPVITDQLIEAICRTRHKNSKKENNHKTEPKRSESKKCLLSFMGSGESLANLQLIKKIHEQENKIKRMCNYDEISYALATIMPNKHLPQFTDYVIKQKLPIKIHFSMHTPFTHERFSLVPNTKVTVEEALRLLVQYRNKIVGVREIQQNLHSFHPRPDPVEIHYTLIKGVNDSDQHLEEVNRLIKKYLIPFKLLCFNETNNLEKSEREQKWITRLQQANPTVRVRSYTSPGRQIGSSCGMFTKHYYLAEEETAEEHEEFKKWEATHKIETS